MSCFVVLTPEQIYLTALGAGFPPDTAVKMVAIALRESSGCPDATNIRAAGTNSATDPGEASYGLWQINVGPKGNYRLLSQMGIPAEALLIPEVNAQAAMRLWNGNDSNLNTAWYINRYGTPYRYAEKYQENLLLAQAAQNNVRGLDTVAIGNQMEPVLGGATPVQLAAGLSVGTVLVLAGAFSLLLLIQD